MGDTKHLKIVDFHCHYAGPLWPALPPVNSAPEHIERWKGFTQRIGDIDGVVRDQERSDIDLRVLSAPPALVSLDGARLPASMMRSMNDHLAEVIAERDGLAGLATVDAYQGDVGAEEVVRAHRELNLSGIVVDCARSHAFLDAPEARATLEAAAEEGLPVFAHPVSPAELSAELGSLGNFGRMLARGTSSAASLFALVNAGVLDEIRGLKLIFAWLGGGALVVGGTVKGAERLRHDAREDQRWHVYFDTMGFDHAALRYAVDVVGSDHVVVGSDWPIGVNIATRDRVITALDAAGLSSKDQVQVASRNALDLLGLST